MLCEVIMEMDLSSLFVFKILEIKNEDPTCLVYRTNFVTEEDGLKWLDEYSKKTNTNWIVKNGLYNPERYVMHKNNPPGLVLL